MLSHLSNKYYITYRWYQHISWFSLVIHIDFGIVRFIVYFDKYHSGTSEKNYIEKMYRIYHETICSAQNGLILGKKEKKSEKCPILIDATIFIGQLRLQELR